MRRRAGSAGVGSGKAGCLLLQYFLFIAQQVPYLLGMKPDAEILRNLMFGENLIVIDAGVAIKGWRGGTVQELMDDNDIQWENLGVFPETKLIEFEAVARPMEDDDCYYFRAGDLFDGDVKGGNVLLVGDLWGAERELSFFVCGKQAGLV